SCTAVAQKCRRVCKQSDDEARKLRCSSHLLAHQLNRMSRNISKTASAAAIKNERHRRRLLIPGEQILAVCPVRFSSSLISRYSAMTRSLADPGVAGCHNVVATRHLVSESSSSVGPVIWMR